MLLGSRGAARAWFVLVLRVFLAQNKREGGYTIGMQLCVIACVIMVLLNAELACVAGTVDRSSSDDDLLLFMLGLFLREK